MYRLFYTSINALHIMLCLNQEIKKQIFSLKISQAIFIRSSEIKFKNPPSEVYIFEVDGQFVVNHGHERHFVQHFKLSRKVSLSFLFTST